MDVRSKEALRSRCKAGQKGRSRLNEAKTCQIAVDMFQAYNGFDSNSLTLGSKQLDEMQSLKARIVLSLEEPSFAQGYSCLYFGTE